MSFLPQQFEEMRVYRQLNGSLIFEEQQWFTNHGQYLDPNILKFFDLENHGNQCAKISLLTGLTAYLKGHYNYIDIFHSLYRPRYYDLWYNFFAYGNNERMFINDLMELLNKILEHMLPDLANRISVETYNFGYDDQNNMGIFMHFSDDNSEYHAENLLVTCYVALIEMDNRVGHYELMMVLQEDQEEFGELEDQEEYFEDDSSEYYSCESFDEF